MANFAHLEKFEVGQIKRVSPRKGATAALCQVEIRTSGKVVVDNLDEHVKYNLHFLALDTVGYFSKTFTYNFFS